MSKPCSNRRPARRLKFLREISFYTDESYDGEVVKLSALKTQLSPPDIELVESELPEVTIYDFEIQKKEKELAIQKKEWLPSVSAYTYYNLFGSDPNQPNRAVTGFRDRSFTFGFSVNVPIFDGFKNLAQVKRAALEIKKLHLEKDQKIAELWKEFDATRVQAVGYQVVSNHQADAAIHSAHKTVMEERLSAEALLDRITVLKQQVALVQDELSLKQAEIDQKSAVLKLALMTKGMAG